jgi:hypothetical protein
MVALLQTVDRPRDPSGSSRLLSQVAWAPESDLDVTQWRAVGRSLGRLGRNSQWWVGDWLLYGCGKWGEQYAEAVKLTGYDYGSLRNMACVSRRFDLSRRRDKLSWEHHASVQSLMPSEQDHWLDRAVELRWTREDLRTELRAAERGGYSRTETPEPPEAGGPTVVVCPKCGDAIEISDDVIKAILSARNPG